MECSTGSQDEISQFAHGKNKRLYSNIQIAQCVQSITTEKGDPGYIIQIPMVARYVSGLGKEISQVDIDVGKRVAVTPESYTIVVCFHRTHIIPLCIESIRSVNRCFRLDDGS